MPATASRGLATTAPVHGGLLTRMSVRPQAFVDHARSRRGGPRRPVCRRGPAAGGVNMSARCPPVGSARGAPRRWWPHTVSPLACDGSAFALHRRRCTRWHGACFTRHCPLHGKARIFSPIDCCRSSLGGCHDDAREDRLHHRCESRPRLGNGPGARQAGRQRAARSARPRQRSTRRRRVTSGWRRAGCARSL
jgi:hypothetical protein